MSHLCASCAGGFHDGHLHGPGCVCPSILHRKKGSRRAAKSSEPGRVREHQRERQRVGDAAEKFWETQHEIARLLGVLVHVQHNQPATKMVHGRLIYTKKSACDFTGTMADARTFCAESKSVSGRLARSAIQPLQAVQLDAVSKAGGAAFLLVEFRRDGRNLRFAIPWTFVGWKKLRSAESLGVEDVVMEHVVQPGTCYLKPGALAPLPVGFARRYPRE